jgi:hypothetical protein
MMRMKTKENPQLEQYFQQFRKNIIGINQDFNSPYGQNKLSIQLDSQWSFIPSY